MSVFVIAIKTRTKISTLTITLAHALSLYSFSLFFSSLLFSLLLLVHVSCCFKNAVLILTNVSIWLFCSIAAVTPSCDTCSTSPASSASSAPPPTTAMASVMKHRKLTTLTFVDELQDGSVIGCVEAVHDVAAERVLSSQQLAKPHRPQRRVPHPTVTRTFHKKQR
jgi:hypothetical protein